MYKARALPCLCFVLMLTAAVCLFPLSASGASGSLTTSFNGNITFQGNMFNVTVQQDGGITVTAFDIHILRSAQPVPIRVYCREGGYQGYETNESAWTLVQDGNVTSQGYSAPTPLPLNSGLALSAGKTYGIYITINGSHDVSEMIYTDSASVYSNAHISISTAAGLSWPLFTDPYSPRTWNGTIYYDYAPVSPQTGDAAGGLLWLYGMIAAASGSLAAHVVWRRYTARRGT